jgi:O-acetyl-ADP-ribose deacetylase (regulator of RNase III)
VSEINYVTGDATRPQGDGVKIVAHIVNDEGKWGRGFVIALSRRWGAPEDAYRMWCDVPTNLSWCQGEGLPKLGNVQFVAVEADIIVANMMAQRCWRRRSTDPRALDYSALRFCLDKLGREAVAQGASVHMPRIGCGLGGGEWSVVEEAILACLVDVYELTVTVYDLPDSVA